MTDLIDYRDLSGTLQRLGYVDEPSEYHGILCGVLCLVSPRNCNPLTVADAGEPRLSGSDPEAAQTLVELRDATWESLCSPDMDFAPLLPDDEQKLAPRVSALAAWCDGFLFGLAGHPAFSIDDCSEEAREIIGDLTQFTQVGLAVDEDDEMEESAYAELVEYIRVGAQLVFMELHPRDDKGDGASTSPTLH